LVRAWNYFQGSRSPPEYAFSQTSLLYSQKAFSYVEKTALSI
jgi:hypothetical protein